MIAFLERLFDTSGFPPRWHCGEWSEGHGWLHIASDAAIFGAYFAIPVVLTFFVLRRKDVPFPRVFWLFAAFILCCGIGHLIEATLFWHPWYRLSGAVKFATALVSWATVLALIPLVPKALALPGLARVNARLEREIAERMRAEDDRRRIEAQFQQTQKLESLGVLAGGIAHDFNNLLTSILGFADLAHHDLPRNSPTRQLVQEVINGAQRASELTNQMLAYSGKGRFVIEPLNLSEVVEGMSRLVQVSVSKKCSIRSDLRADLPAIAADAAQVKQVVMNLIINASEAIGDRPGEITLRTGAMHCDREYLSQCYLDEKQPEGRYVYFQVADTGCGMSAETRARIFDPFFTTKFTGRGLGLAAVLGIVRGHRGAVRVESEPGRGTTFTILFPETDAPARPREVAEEPREEWCATGTALVVDDDASVRALAIRMLERMGFSVLTAENGRRGVETFRREAERLSLVILDMTMPEMNGEEAFREMRAAREGVKTILCSGYNEQTATSHFTGLGLAGFIQKPFTFEQLLGVVRKVLDAPGGPQPGRSN